MAATTTSSTAPPSDTIRPQVTVSTAPPKHGFNWRGILLHGTIIFFCMIIILPLLWVLLLSVKTVRDANTGTFWPTEFDFTNYSYVLTQRPEFIYNMGNSIFVTLSTVLLTCVCALLGGYALVHLKVRGRYLITALLVGSLFFPTRLISLIAIFEIQNDLGLRNTLIGLVLPYVTLNLATSVLIMRGMFEQISTEIVDAAHMDGCNTWQTFWAVLLPLVKNGIVVLVIVNFVTAWGEYLLAYTLIDDQSVRTMPVVLASTFGGLGAWSYPRVAAMYIMVTTPGIIVFAFAQRWYMKGLLEGALKF
jgi:ABC-type glycerol-3-phosphate transport system permease component